MKKMKCFIILVRGPANQLQTTIPLQKLRMKAITLVEMTRLAAVFGIYSLGLERLCSWKIQKNRRMTFNEMSKSSGL